MLKNLGKIESESKFNLTNAGGTTYYKETNGRYYYCCVGPFDYDVTLRWHRATADDYENAWGRYYFTYGMEMA